MLLEEYITNNSLSVADFAQIIGVKSRATVHRYINGRLPKKDVLEKIIAATNGKVTANDFIEFPLKIKQNKAPNSGKKGLRQGNN